MDTQSVNLGQHEIHTVTVGEQEFALAELNRYQGMKLLDEMLEAGNLFKNEKTRQQGQDMLNALRMKCILWSMNNAAKWPDKDNRFGSMREPFCEEDLATAFSLKTYGPNLETLYGVVLQINGLLKAQPGERTAEMMEDTHGHISAVV